MDNLVNKTAFKKYFMRQNIFVGTLDPRKLFKLKINHMNIFHIKTSQITISLVYTKFGHLMTKVNVDW